MSDKLEALSQPVGLVTNQLDGAVIVESDQLLPGDNVYSQEYVTALLAALEEKDRELEKECDILIDTQESMREWRQRSEAAKQREDHLKADVALMAQRNKELAEHNAELQQRLQQPIKLPLAEGESKQEYLDKVIEVLNGAGLQIRYHCPRCNGLLDLTSRPDGDHYCHQQAKVEGE